MKDKLGGKTMKEFVVLRAKTYSYLTDDNKESQKKNAQKMCHKKRITKIVYKHLVEKQTDVKKLTENHKDFLINKRLIL